MRSTGYDRQRGGDHAKPLTALWHHVDDINRLREAYDGLHHEAAPGVDGQTWAAYGENLEANLQDLADRLKRGGHARPVERVYIPKPEGRQRPIGLPTPGRYERPAGHGGRAERHLRGRVARILLLDFDRGAAPPDAREAVTVGMGRKVHWVLDADIRGFFDSAS